MSAKSEAELTMEPRSEIVAPGSRDTQKTIDDLMAALRKSIAERARMSDQERQVEVWEMQKLAAQGAIAAQHSLGHKYYLGQDVPQD